MYKVARVVLGENKTFVGGERYLKRRGIEVVNLNNAECQEMMKNFIREHPEDWYIIPFVSFWIVSANARSGMRTLARRDGDKIAMFTNRYVGANCVHASWPPDG